MQSQLSIDRIHGVASRGAEVKRISWVWLAVLGLLTLSACAAGPNPLMDQSRGAFAPAGFWFGLWHGMISPATFLISLFSERVGVYEVFNTGHWYDFGFGVGVVLALSGGGGGATVVHGGAGDRKKPGKRPEPTLESAAK